MIFDIDGLRLDVDRVELRRGEEEVALEPKGFALLRLLIENRDRMVSRDEIIETIWEGRFISDASISTLVKSVRQALGDDGGTQKYIRTVRGRGFRFIGPAQEIEGPSSPSKTPARPTAPKPTETAEAGRPTIGVIPFRMLAPGETFAPLGDAIPAELISSLSRLRWLRVVARGSSFRFREDPVDLDAIRTLLGAQYCLSGVIEIFGPELTVGVELSDTRSLAVIWSERLSGKLDDVHQMREEIVANVLGALELRIPVNEAQRARLLSPENLDAWGMFHLGLQHIFRFTPKDTEIAAGHFERAIGLDPSFARAHAGLSLVHFHRAFQKFSDDGAREETLALRCAEAGMALDPLDPFVLLSQGRAEWLNDDFDASLHWMERSIDLNPNYAYAHYNRGLLRMIDCHGAEGVESAVTAHALSPLDPVRASISTLRAMSSHMRGDHAEAIRWANRSVRDTGRHAFVYALTAIVYAEAGDQNAASANIASLLEATPTFRQADFFRRFNFTDPARKEAASKTLAALGLK